jgi:hypothetical protein
LHEVYSKAKAGLQKNNNNPVVGYRYDFKEVLLNFIIINSQFTQLLFSNNRLLCIRVDSHVENCGFLYLGRLGCRVLFFFKLVILLVGSLVFIYFRKS